MKLYYICPKSLWHQWVGRFISSNYIDLPNDMIVFCGCMDEGIQADFEADPHIVKMPHLLSRQGQPSEVVGYLKDLGINATHSTFDAAMLLKKVHPLMGPEL